MPLFEVFIPTTDPDGFNITARIRADSWIQALRNGLAKLGDAADVRNIMCDIHETGIDVTDPQSGRVFRITELPEEDAPAATAPPPAAGAPPPPVAAGPPPAAAPPVAAPAVAAPPVAAPAVAAPPVAAPPVAAPPVTPHTEFANGPGAIAPPAAATPPPQNTGAQGYDMTAKATGSYASHQAAGWTDAQLIAEGLMELNDIPF